MNKILISMIILMSFVNADIIYLTVMKKGKSIDTKHIEMDDSEKYTKHEGFSLQPVKGKNKITTIHISNFWDIKERRIYKYKTFKVLNRSDIKKDFMIIDNELKIMINENEYIETFKIEVKPDRDKYYWKTIENKYGKEIKQYMQSKNRRKRDLI